jgi:hypothetical protein
MNLLYEYIKFIVAVALILLAYFYLPHWGH